MQEHDDVFVINESFPPKEPPSHEIRIVKIVAEQIHGAKPHKPHAHEIDDLIKRLAPDSITTFRIEQTSRLACLPPIDRFRNLEVVEIEASHVKELTPLFALEHLTKLVINCCQPQSLSALRGRPFSYVRLMRGNVIHFDLTTRKALLQACRHLVSFEDAEIYSLALESCAHVDLSTLASVRGLTILEMVASGPVVTNFDFLAGCDSLKVLSITTPLAKADFSALGQAPALRCAHLAVKRNVLKQLASDFPNLVLTNGNVCFVGQQEMPYFENYERERRAALGIPEIHVFRDSN
jgi:hypothetical protein